MNAQNGGFAWVVALIEDRVAAREVIASVNLDVPVVDRQHQVAKRADAPRIDDHAGGEALRRLRTEVRVADVEAADALLVRPA